MEILKVALPYVQVGIAVLLIITILLQQRGSGLSSSFGGQGNVYSTKRGLEKILFRSSIALGALFLIAALLNLILA